MRRTLESRKARVVGIRDVPAIEKFEIVFACNGQIDALRMLTTRYRFSTFVLLIKGEEVACKNLHVERDVMRYRFPGPYINHVERVETHKVERLIRVVK